MPTPIRVLHIEDNEDDAFLIRRELERGGFELAAYQRVETEPAMREAIEKPDWDLLMSDYQLPNFNGLEALKVFGESNLDIPFFLISGAIGEQTAVAAMKAGAHDYLMKDDLARLAPAVERELRDAETRRQKRLADERFRALIEHTSDLILVLNPDGTGRYVGMALERLLGYKEDQMVGKSVKDFIHPDDMASIASAIALCLRKPEPKGQVVELRVRHAHNGWRTFEAIATNLLDNPAVGGIVVNARDITERKRAEEQIRRQLDRLAALRTIDQTIASVLDLRLMLSLLLDQVIAQLHVDAADVLLLNPHTQTLEYAAGRGFRTNAIERSRLRLGEGHAGRVALERRTVSVHDMRTEKGIVRSNLLAGEDFEFYHGAPLIAKGQVKGVLEVFLRSHREPDDEWLNFFETLAGQVAIAVDNVTLFEGLQRANLELGLAYDATIEGWSHALDLRDKETEGHSQRVTDKTVEIARDLGMSEEQLIHVRRGALLHDIGKMGVPDGILLKPGKLTDEEWVIMSKHPQFAYDMLAPIAYLRPALDIPYCHHEKWDGTGYPRGLKGEQIPLPARIFAVVDVYDALTSDRPYSKAWTKEKALGYIREQSGHHFDPRVVDAFLGKVANIG